MDKLLIINTFFTHVRQMSDMANNDLEKYGKALDKCVVPPLLWSHARPNAFSALSCTTTV